jgi:hypothetical protein
MGLTQTVNVGIDLSETRLLDSWVSEVVTHRALSDTESFTGQARPQRIAATGHLCFFRNGYAIRKSQRTFRGTADEAREAAEAWIEQHKDEWMTYGRLPEKGKGGKK